MRRIPLWFIALLFGGILLIGLLVLPLALFMPWDDLFGDGGIADQLLNVFAYGLLFVIVALPMGLGGAVLVWQPGRQEEKKSYSVLKAAGGLLMVWFAVMLVRTALSDPPPFPTSRTDAAARAAADD